MVVKEYFIFADNPLKKRLTHTKKRDSMLYGRRCQIIKRGDGSKMRSKNWGISMPLMLTIENGG